VYRRQPAWTLFFFAVQYLFIGTFALAATTPMAPAALINLVVAGKIPLSPTIFDANVTLRNRKARRWNGARWNRW